MRRLKPRIPILMPLLLTVAISPLLAQDAFQLTEGKVGVAYQFKIQTDGGLPPLHWAIKTGTLPPGLKLQDGVISGTPSQAQANPFQFSLEVSDSSQPAQDYSQSFSILIKAPPLRMVLNPKPLTIITSASSQTPDTTPDPLPGSLQATPVKKPAGSKPGDQAPPPADPGKTTPSAPTQAPPVHTALGDANNVPALITPRRLGTTTPLIVAPAQVPPQASASASPPKTFGDCDLAPCIDQPYEGQTQISGKVAAGTAVSVAIKEKNFNGNANSSGVFVVGPIDPPVAAFNVVTVTADGGKSHASIAVKPQSTCDAASKSLPCLDQPFEGDTEVTGSLEAKPPEGAVVTIKINGTEVKKTSGQIESSKFTFSNLHALNQYNTVEVIESLPATQDGAPPPTTGKVTVKAAVQAKLPSTPRCLAVSPGWVTIPSQSKSQSTIPIKITSCDTPAVDLSKDVVRWVDEVKVSTGIKLDTTDADAKVTWPTCKSAATSELDCNLTITSAAERRPHNLKVEDASGTLIGNVTLHIGDPDHYWIGMAGLDVTGTQGGPQQQWFARASLMDRLFHYDDKHAHGGLWAWVDAKVGSIPTAKTTALSSLASASTAVSASGIQNVGDITQSLEFHAGIAPSIGSKIVSLLVGFGGASPINPITGAQEYSLSQNLYNQFAHDPTQTLKITYSQLWNYGLPCYAPSPPSSCTSKPTTVAFVLPNRSRFYRDYFGGFRFWFNPRNNGNNFPGLFDVTVGQDEVVTHARFHGVVLTLQGDYPVDSNGLVRIFGSVHMKIARNIDNIALDMAPVTGFVDPTTSAVVVQPTNPLDQDYFRIGVGFDLGQVWSALTKPKTSPPASAAAPAKTPSTAPAP